MRKGLQQGASRGPADPEGGIVSRLWDSNNMHAGTLHRNRRCRAHNAMLKGRNGIRVHVLCNLSLVINLSASEVYTLLHVVLTDPLSHYGVR